MLSEAQMHILKKKLIAYACRNAKIDAVMELLNHGAVIYSGCNIYGVPIQKFILKSARDNGDTMLHVSIKRGYHKLVDLILRIEGDRKISADLPKPSLVRNREGLLPLDLAMRNGNTQLVNLFLKLMGSLSSSALDKIFLMDEVSRKENNILGLQDFNLLSKSLDVTNKQRHHIHLLGNDPVTKAAIIKILGKFNGKQGTTSPPSQPIPLSKAVSNEADTNHVKIIVNEFEDTQRIIFDYEVSY